MSGNSEESSRPMPIDPLDKDPFDQTSTSEKMDDGFTIPKKVLDILDKADEKKQEEGDDEKLIKTKKMSLQSANDFLKDDDSDEDMKDLSKSDASSQDKKEIKVEKKPPVKKSMFEILYFDNMPASNIGQYVKSENISISEMKNNSKKEFKQDFCGVVKRTKLIHCMGCETYVSGETAGQEFFTNHLDPKNVPDGIKHAEKVSKQAKDFMKIVYYELAPYKREVLSEEEVSNLEPGFLDKDDGTKINDTIEKFIHCKTCRKVFSPAKPTVQDVLIHLEAHKINLQLGGGGSDSSKRDSSRNTKSRTPDIRSSPQVQDGRGRPILSGLLQVLHFDGKTDELIKTEDISKNQATKANEDFFLKSLLDGNYRRIRCVPCKKDYDKPCGAHLNSTTHKLNMRLHLTIENEPEGDQKVENPDEADGTIQIQSMYVRMDEEEVFKTEPISKNEAKKLDDAFFLQDSVTGFYKQIKCVPCGKSWKLPNPHHWDSISHTLKYKVYTSNKEENTWLNRSRSTQVQCIEILYYDGVTNEVFKTENMSKNQAMKVDEEFFRQDPESGVYKQIRCTACEQNFQRPQPKHWHATGHRKNMKKLYESQEGHVPDPKIQELTNSAGLLEVLTYETNTNGPVPLPFSGEEIPFSNSDDNKNWIEDISKKTEISLKEAKELEQSFYKKDSKTGLIRRIRCVACEQMIQSKDMLLSHLDGKKHGKNVYVYVASGGGEHLELEPQKKKAKMESTPYFYQ